MNCKFLSIGWMISLICSWAPLLDAALPIVPITISNDNSSLINSTSLNDTSLTDNQTSSSTILTPSNSSGNVSGPIPASAPSWMNASHLFTIELLLGTPLTYPTNDTASRVGEWRHQAKRSIHFIWSDPQMYWTHLSRRSLLVRPILNGTISGLALNATILGGLAFTMVQATSPSSASSIASASFWGLSSNNQSLFITQTELRPKLSKPRLGRLVNMSSERRFFYFFVFVENDFLIFSFHSPFSFSLMKSWRIWWLMFSFFFVFDEFL